MSAATTASRGFTLPELLTALAITGLTLSLAVPSLNNVIAGQRRATAVNNLVGSLHLARSSAMTRNEPVTICPSADGVNCTTTPWEQGWLVFVDPALQREPGADRILASEYGLSGTMTVQSVEFAQALSYQPNGLPVSSRGANESGAFWFCEASSDTAGRGLWINASGKPRLVDQQANGRPFECTD
ncbi:MAG: GspH/FimT family pseudopilin [Chromatiales bacterium]|nr:MAG: GspH/FimT family pseudopilin [Chromatiales bacterium]